MNISVVIPGDREKEVIEALHSCFFEGECLVPMTANRDNCEEAAELSAKA